ncbi:ankyrin repeat domain-containing protein [Rhodovulum steppense]|uniref:Ankyrin repeat protein n=1 Tax=Rhodovulum steppense TaxID=540251 RepID=A0A4R1YVK1_9RHOB|nr:ankyrin repeat domain-containing protein [Rhodovulum steppense]TCM85159.1 ankyrin repeat protein [Rhodovulum steppense]
MGMNLADLLSELEGASRSGAFDRFEDLVTRVEAAVEAMTPDIGGEAARARRRIAALRVELVRSPGFTAENDRLCAALAAAEAEGDTLLSQRLSEALYRRGKAIMATLRVREDEAEPTDEPTRELFAAIAADDVDRLRACLAGSDIDARHGPLQETALFHALSVEGRSVAMVEFLLAQGADPNAGMADGYRPLHAVAAYPWGWESATIKAVLTDLLVKMGGDIEARTESWGWTPLHRAVLEGSADELEALLRAGADPNAPFDERSQPWFTPGRLPLQIAGHDTAKVRLLLDYGADPRRTDGLGEDTASYLRMLIAEHLAHRAEEDAHRAGLERSLELVRDWPARS